MKAQVDLPLPSVWIIKAKISLYILIKEKIRFTLKKNFSLKMLSFPSAVQTDVQTVLQPFSAILNKPILQLQLPALFLIHPQLRPNCNFWTVNLTTLWPTTVNIKERYWEN